ncbi:MAG: diadenylate cyclase CdaA [Bacteroidota bacterium]|nr:diadenylate cyclase CdaA [Bacteroidota bacterium]
MQLFDFLSINFIDLIDIVFVAFLIYFLYRIVKGTIAFNIFLGFLSVYLLWWVVMALDMTLLSRILGQFIGVGALALIIVFQQEIRKFLLIIGQNNIFVKSNFSVNKLFPWNWKVENPITLNYSEIVSACNDMSKTKTGALIVIPKSSELRNFASTGISINASITSHLIKSIFIKNSPLHDGAVIVVKNKISAASCILPVSDNINISSSLGLRHRAAIGISEQSDAFVIIVSEETGEISIAKNAVLFHAITIKELEKKLDDNFFHFKTV